METLKRDDNRAASPLFCAFGGRLTVPEGDALVFGRFPGSHHFEWLLLSLLIPLGFGVAVFDGLWRLGGMAVAMIGGLPVMFFGIQIFALVIGVGSPRRAFWVWGGVLALWSWAILKWGGETPAKWMAWVWLGFMVLQLPGLLGMMWRRLMRVSGRPGMAIRTGIAVAAHLLLPVVGWQFGWPWALLCGAVMVVFWGLGTFLPTNEFFGPMPGRHQGREPLLTIDDGPDPEDTPVILDRLDKHGVKAVFFVIGEKVRKHPELTREIVARGHELANHSMTHPQHSMWCAGPGRTRREIAECSRVIEEVSGKKPRWYRAPVGHRNFFTHPVASELGMEIVVWSRRGYDTTDRPVDDMVRDLTRDLGSGEILLLHESTPVAKEVVKRVLEDLG